MSELYDKIKDQNAYAVICNVRTALALLRPDGKNIHQVNGVRCGIEGMYACFNRGLLPKDRTIEELVDDINKEKYLSANVVRFVERAGECGVLI